MLLTDSKVCSKLSKNPTRQEAEEESAQEY